jgi:hypothetical protein
MCGARAAATTTSFELSPVCCSDTLASRPPETPIDDVAHVKLAPVIFDLHPARMRLQVEGELGTGHLVGRPAFGQKQISKDDLSELSELRDL